MSDNDVKTWQRFLRERGVYSGLIDGDFGPGTRRASFEIVNGQGAAARLVMVNQNATRNRPITALLSNQLIEVATAVYGSGCELRVYSGGQDRKGHGSRRTGSVRHDDFGRGGRAADLYVYLQGRKLTGIALARLGQYWLARGLGGVGLEMATGGIHLDEWTTPPPGGGMFWTYAYSDAKPWGPAVRAMLEAGARGEVPA